MALLGPKLSVSLLVLSVWGIVMLLLLGIFARVNAVALAEDIYFDQAKWASSGYSYQYIDDRYKQLSNNCFIAAGIYVLLLVFSGIQYRLNMVNSYAAPN
ncbi:hypothetical protein BOX15_Mlig005191g1 [Macrostomum lignano]|uniref:Uncharacterized protein n=1 Tax=Macrostomum lignano TaxID=282301 RepID=A0A267GKX8_9PLAT|nr:hypothetical protein BOX15_Mlig023321g1 [Macrostomum lignano]PAA86680.1 hypothetical protein BOX15_Mlig005191g1 [Macrostomum lignano]